MPLATTMDAPKEQPSAIPDAVMRALHGYWESKRNGGMLPRRSDIEPTEMISLLPHVMIVDIHREADGRHRHWFRLVGTQVAFGTDPTGTFLDEGVSETAYGKHITGLYSRASQLGRPLYSEYDYEHPVSHGVRHAKRLFLPLAGDAGVITKMLVGQLVAAPTWLERSLWQIQPEMIHERLLFEVAGDI